MALKITRVGEIIGSDIVPASKLAGDFANILTNLEPTTDTEPGPQWRMPLVIGEGASRRSISIDLAPFLSAAQYSRSNSEPFVIDAAKKDIGHLLLFRNRFFLTERPIMSASEQEEVGLRAKKIVYDEEGELTALRAFVANIEAAVEYQRFGPNRDPIPEDAKLLVWSRDGGACIRCESRERLRFDHIIPVAKGGSNDPMNIQILCQVCNLKKSDKIVF